MWLKVLRVCKGEYVTLLALGVGQVSARCPSLPHNRHFAGAI